jgi:hypothetical protein
MSHFSFKDEAQTVLFNDPIRWVVIHSVYIMQRLLTIQLTDTEIFNLFATETQMSPCSMHIRSDFNRFNI